MKKRLGYLSLEKTILILVFLVVALSLLVTSLLVSREAARSTEKDLANHALDIARIVANSPIVIDGLTSEGNKEDVQIYANELTDITKVSFIVVMDMEGRRISHPNAEQLGKPFQGGDEGPVLQGQEHISKALGTLGMSLRAFTPVYDSEGKQVGAVAVGILMDTVDEAVRESLSRTYFGIGVGFIIGAFGAIALAKRLKGIMFGLEPYEIARILQERNAMLESVREGVIAIDAEGKINLANGEAIRLLNLAGIKDVYGMDMEILDQSVLKRVLDTGEPILDYEHDFGGVSLLSNTVPLKVNGEIVGAISSFRDKTEIKQLAEELSGVKIYADALRAQAHEFMNKIHVILGLAHMKNYDQLKDYVSQLAQQYQSKSGSIVRNIRDPILAGFIQAKMSFARENGCVLELSENSYCPQAQDATLVHDLVTIVGNLLNNAIEAVKDWDNKQIRLSVIYTEGQLAIEVTNYGPIIPEAVRENIFVKGYSTKSNGRGFGLFLVKKTVEERKGLIQVASDAVTGTIFRISLPYEPREESL